MSDLVLLRPLWLLALLPLAGLYLWSRRRQSSGPWTAHLDPDLVPVLRRLGFLTQGGASYLSALPFLAAALLALALTGPARLRPGATEFRALDPLILILDLSPSVVAEEAGLRDLQFGAAELLATSGGRLVGMMVYAADAYLASPPSADPESLQGLVASLSREVIPIAGSRPDIALSMARDFFASGEGSLVGADLVVLSDGGGAGVRAVEEAARLRSDGMRVWVLALTHPAPGAPPPDPEALAALAKAGGGEARPVSDVTELGAAISRARTAALARQEGSSAGFRDLGPWLLPLPMLLLLPFYRRRR